MVGVLRDEQRFVGVGKMCENPTGFEEFTQLRGACRSMIVWTRHRRVDHHHRNALAKPLERAVLIVTAHQHHNRSRRGRPSQRILH